MGRSRRLRSRADGDHEALTQFVYSRRGTRARSAGRALEALVQLLRRLFGLRRQVSPQHRLQRLVVPDGERVIAGLVMRPHQESVRFLVVGFALEEPLERADRGFWLF